MPNKYNPFKPNHPIYTGLFAGRYDELKKIDNSLFQTSFNNPTNLLFIGERGIGKTSLLLVAKFFGQGELTWEDKTHNFLTIQLTITSTLTLPSFILKFKNILQKELHKCDKSQKIIDEIWGFIKNLEIAGSKINQAQDVDYEVLKDNFIYSIIDTIKLITNDKENPKEGILLLIDEADTASQSLNLGSFLKNLTESLVSENCNRLLIIMAGLPHVRDCLRISHDSSLRLFEEITLNPLNLDDVKYVVNKAIQEINEKDPQVHQTITDEAYEKFFELSEGYPHFLQQLGYSTIALKDSNPITGIDVSDSMFAKGGALEQIGNRYYIDMFYNKINVDSYRQILTIMAEKWNEWISKNEIRKSFTGTSTSLANGLNALKERNIILARRGFRGQYRLQWLSFAFWIKIHKMMKY